MNQYEHVLTISKIPIFHSSLKHIKKSHEKNRHFLRGYPLHPLGEKPLKRHDDMTTTWAFPVPQGRPAGSPHGEGGAAAKDLVLDQAGCEAERSGERYMVYIKGYL